MSKQNVVLEIIAAILVTYLIRYWCERFLDDQGL
jgi:branched-subunit amino acid transport protein